MALVFADGFDHYLAADILAKWTGWISGTSMANSLRISPDYARPPGGMGIVFGDNGVNRGIYKTFPTTHASFVSGFAFYAGATPLAMPLWAVFDSASGVPASTPQLALRGDGAGHLTIVRGTTVIATSTNVFSLNTWYFIEIKATIHNTTGAYEVRVNGSSTGWLPAATGQNTRGQSANNFVDIVALGTNQVATHRFDDFYFLSAGAPNNDFLGPQKIVTLFPAGAGNYAQWSGNYASNYTNANELAGDSDNTFNQSATANQIDSFVFDDVPTGTIAAVQHTLLVRQDAGAARTVAPLQRSGGTDYVGSTLAVAGSYQYLTDPRDTDPATAAAYTAANVNAAEFGYKLIS